MRVAHGGRHSSTVGGRGDCRAAGQGGRTGGEGGRRKGRAVDGGGGGQERRRRSRGRRRQLAVARPMEVSQEGRALSAAHHSGAWSSVTWHEEGAMVEVIVGAVARVANSLMLEAEGLVGC